ncbi:MAG: hypothetical protein MJ150_04355, partial [Clostridia bacterium]|nr:hypothetical protein [Clostridia bacterium]
CNGEGKVILKETCQYCTDGVTRSMCPDCSGTGHIKRDPYKTCSECKGTGKVGYECAWCEGTLKRYIGTWYCMECRKTTKDLMLTKAQYYNLQAYHICPKCNDNDCRDIDVRISSDPCFHCGGKGQLSTCELCKGTGKYYDGTVSDYCYSCKSTGYVEVKCTKCSGEGYTTKTVKCTDCNGTGTN